MTEYAKPLPALTDLNRPFWQSGQHGRLALQRCTACGHVRYPISPFCPRCLSAACEWSDLSGRGTVFSYVVFHRAYHAGFAADVPYNVALIQLDEGPRLYSNIVDTPNDSVRIGDAVEVVFEQVTPQVWIPKFRLRQRPAGTA